MATLRQCADQISKQCLKMRAEKIIAVIRKSYGYIFLNQVKLSVSYLKFLKPNWYIERYLPKVVF